QLFLLAFAALVALGALLLALPWTAADGRPTPPVDALFTAVSAACVTGLVTVDTADHWNRLGQGVILVLMQGGGLSFTVGASIVLQALRRGTSLRDALLLRDGEPALSVREALDLSRRILRFTLTVEAAGAVALALGFGLDLDLRPTEAAWFGLFHAVSAFCNASFDLSGGFRSLTPYRDSVWLNVVVAALIQAGALSYLVLGDVWRQRRWRPLTLDAKLVLLAHALLVASGAAVFLALEWGQSLAGAPAWAKPMAALFHSVAARSGGFATVNLGEAGAATLFVFVGIMLVGGAPGSTAGGVRLTTVAVVVVAVVATLRGQTEPQLFGRRVATSLVFRAMAVVALFGLAHFVATLALAVTENALGGADLAFIAIMFEAASALATDGLSTGITPGLSTAGKLVLCATMFLGRVGPLTAVYALQHRQRPPRHRFPEAPLRIG
ncbi:MAG: Trk family potassium uptake protein, partial [Chloroflexota bacterium]|nr:Trk family potassium uptake protein [Chloroflexota bacterium]